MQVIARGLFIIMCLIHFLFKKEGDGLSQGCLQEDLLFRSGLFIAGNHVQTPAVLAFPVVFMLVEVNQKAVAIIADLTKRAFSFSFVDQPIFLAVKLNFFRKIKDIGNF